MKRHPLNAFSLVFGILLTLLAAWTAFAPRGPAVRRSPVALGPPPPRRSWSARP